MKKTKVYSVAILLFWMAFFLLACSESQQSYVSKVPVVVGNLMGNLHNLGKIAQDGTSIYYSKDGLNQYIKDNKTHKKIYKNRMYNLNTYNGILYFIDIDNENTIWAMDKNSQIKKLYENEASKLYVFKDNVYFISKFTLYVMDIDGSDIRQLSNDRIDSINICDEGIYYKMETESERCDYIYRMSHDGSNKELIYRTEENHSIKRFCLEGDNLIILLENPEELYVVSMLTKEKTVISTGAIPETSLNCNEHFLYYYSMDKREFKQYDFLTGKTKVIRREKVDFVHLINNQIFYSDEQGTIFVMDEDGNNHHRFSN